MSAGDGSGETGGAAGIAAWFVGGERLLQVIAGRVQEPAVDAAAGGRVINLLDNQIGQDTEVGFDLFWLDEIGISPGKLLGVGPFQEPGRGPPVDGGSLLHGAQRFELRPELRLPQILVKIFVAEGLAADRDRLAADIADSRADAATGGDEGTDFATFQFVESAGPPDLGHSGSLD